MSAIIREIYLRRALIRQLVIKDLKIRYSRPMLGFLWAFLTPFLTALIFYLIFSLLFKVTISEAPFFLYLMSAIFPWYFFQESLVVSTTSIFDNRNLIRESNFPHYLIPLAIILGNMINTLPSLVILAIFSFFILKGLPVFIILLPFILFLHMAILLGLSVLFSTLYVRWRDIKYLLNICLLFLFYLTPVFYSLRMIKDSFPSLLANIYLYNPLVGILNLYRIAFLKGFFGIIWKDGGLFSLFFIPLGFAIFVLVLGFSFYNWNKDKINDYLSY